MKLKNMRLKYWYWLVSGGTTKGDIRNGDALRLEDDGALSCAGTGWLNSEDWTKSRWADKDYVLEMRAGKQNLVQAVDDKDYSLARKLLTAMENGDATIKEMNV